MNRTPLERQGFGGHLPVRTGWERPTAGSGLLRRLGRFQPQCPNLGELFFHFRHVPPLRCHVRHQGCSDACAVQTRARDIPHGSVVELDRTLRVGLHDDLPRPSHLLNATLNRSWDPTVSKYLNTSRRSCALRSASLHFEGIRERSTH